jgi:hypothetical protein
MEELWLVCEGEPGSIDVTVLTQVFAAVLVVGIVVEPACGNSPNVVARFLQMRRGGRAAHLWDRDYHSRAEADASMTDGTPGFFWRRHSIENYLLPPVVILHALRRLCEQIEKQRRGRAPAWFAALPDTLEAVAARLRACADRRAAEEACRLANHRLWAGLPPAVGHVQKRDPPAPNPGGSVESHHWREALCQEAERVSLAGGNVAACVHFQRAAVEPLYDAAFAEVTAAPYVDGMEFLLDFHGRDLLTEFYQSLRADGVQFSYDRFVAELIPAVVEEYRANRTVFGTDDFRDLANGVRAITGLPPLP